MMLRYEDIARRLADSISAGVLTPGTRLPSIRDVARRYLVSASTAVRAYECLAAARLIEVRPQSGHYVSAAVPARGAARPASRTIRDPKAVRVADLLARLNGDNDPPSVVPLGAAVPDGALLPFKQLTRHLRDTARTHSDEHLAYPPATGVAPLREQLARRSISWGSPRPAEAFVITAGASQALSLCLRAVSVRGDVVAVESPCFYGILQLLEAQGLRALEVPSHPEAGLDVDALEAAIRRNRIKATVVTTIVSNPLGASMPDSAKRGLVALLAKHGIPLIEDDVWGDLSFGVTRPSVAKAHDAQENVLLCGSFSKSMAPGLRIGWILAGRWQKQIELMKFAETIAPPALAQYAVAAYLEHGGYDRHLRRLRAELARQVYDYREAILRAFPAGTTVTHPSGGCALWVGLPPRVDAMDLQAAALRRGVRILPGPLFSAGARFRNFIRVNCGVLPSTRVRRAILTLAAQANVCSRR